MRIKNVSDAMARLRKDPYCRTYREARDLFLKAYVADVVRECDGDKKRAARILDVSYSLIKEKTNPAFACEHLLYYRRGRQRLCVHCHTPV